MKRSCRDLVAILPKRSFHLDLEHALRWCSFESVSRMFIGGSKILYVEGPSLTIF